MNPVDRGQPRRTTGLAEVKEPASKVLPSPGELVEAPAESSFSDTRPARAADPSLDTSFLIPQQEVWSEADRALCGELALIASRLEQEPEGEARDALLSAQKSLTAQLVLSQVADPELAYVASRYVTDRNATGIQQLLLAPRSRGPMVSWINGLSALPPVTREQVTALEMQAIHERRPLYVDDTSAVNYDASGQEYFEQYLHARAKAYPEFQIGLTELTEHPQLVREVALELLDLMRREAEPLLKAELQWLKEDLAERDTPVVLMRHRLKSVDSALNKVHSRAAKIPNYTFNQMTDLLGAQIVLPTYRDIQQLMSRVDHLYGSSGRLVQKENAFVAQAGTGNPTVRLQYLLELEPHFLFELQVRTEEGMTASDLHHNVIYKPELLPVPPRYQQAVLLLGWKTHHRELTEYLESPRE